MDEPMNEAFEALNRYFVGEATMGETLNRVCSAALDAVGPAVFCGISMTVEGRIGTYVFSSPEVIEIDRAQYDTGDGPCVDSFRSGERVVIRSTAADGPYPQFRRVALAHGVRSVLSTPMRTVGTTVGALNLYAERDDAFGDDHVKAADAFASQAAFLLANTRAYWDARTLSENLEQAMKSRAEIEQAKGIIVSTTGCTPDQAFEQLVRQSQHENVKLRDLAAEIVRHAQRRDA